MKDKQNSIGKQILLTFGILLLGIGLGTFSKYLDYRQAELPALLMMIDGALDLHNFLGSFAPWILIAVCIAVYSRTPVWAAVHVLVFFAGMVSSYYLYCNYVAGFFPKSYAMIWVAFTAMSPFLAYLCWYAKRDGWTSCVLSAGIIGVLFNTSFAYGFLYISVTSWLHVLVLLAGMAVLRRNRREMMVMIGAGILFAVMMNHLIPFHIW